MPEPIHEIVEALLDEIGDVQLTGNTWQEARDARAEIQSTVVAYVTPLCEEVDRLYRLLCRTRAWFDMLPPDEPLIEINDTVIAYAVNDWPVEVECECD